MSSADANRCSGSRAIALRVIASRMGGTPARMPEGLGTAPVRRAVAIAAALSPVHGRWPVRSSKRTIPRL